MKVRDIIGLLERDGWFLKTNTRHSHRQYNHPMKLGRVTLQGIQMTIFPRAL